MNAIRKAIGSAIDAFKPQQKRPRCKRFTHVWDELLHVPPACINCGVRQIIPRDPRDPLDFGD